MVGDDPLPFGYAAQHLYGFPGAFSCFDKAESGYAGLVDDIDTHKLAALK
jgi:hypothetical protein